MPTFSVPDGFAASPQVLTLRTMPACEAALALHLVCGAWSAQQLTDGIIPEAAIAELWGRPSAKKATQALCEAGLWEEWRDGYRIRDWAECNETRQEVESRRTEARIRKQRSRMSDHPAAIETAREMGLIDGVKPAARLARLQELLQYGERPTCKLGAFPWPPGAAATAKLLELLANREPAAIVEGLMAIGNAIDRGHTEWPGDTGSEKLWRPHGYLWGFWDTIVETAARVNAGKMKRERNPKKSATILEVERPTETKVISEF